MGTLSESNMAGWEIPEVNRAKGTFDNQRVDLVSERIVPNKKKRTTISPVFGITTHWWKILVTWWKFFGLQSTLVAWTLRAVTSWTRFGALFKRKQLFYLSPLPRKVTTEELCHIEALFRHDILKKSEN